MFIVAAILSLVLAGAFAVAGGAKVTAQPVMVSAAQHTGFSLQSFKLIGIAEIAGALGLVVGLWVAWIGIVAALGLLVTMVSAVAVHARAGDKITGYGPPAALAALTLVTLLLRVATA